MRQSLAQQKYNRHWFLEMKHVVQLARLLRLSVDALKSIVRNANYTTFKIPKKTGGFRLIEAPDIQLMNVQKNLNKFLMAWYFDVRPQAAHGFAPTIHEDKFRPNIITNAAMHVGKEHLLNIDLKDFFHSISTTQVRNFFMEQPFLFDKNLATAIALICCWKKRLPMGAPTSPVLSNMLCMELDNELMHFAKVRGWNFTRYADDLSFSSDTTFDDESLLEIRTIITKHGFDVNERKWHLQSKHSKQQVTGIKVNEKLNVDRTYVKNLRAILNDAENRGIEAAAEKHFGINNVNKAQLNYFRESIIGKVNFVGQVRGREDLVFNRLRQKLMTHFIVQKEFLDADEQYWIQLMRDSPLNSTI